MPNQKIISVEFSAEAYDQLKKKAELVNESMSSLASKALDQQRQWQPIDRRFIFDYYQIEIAIEQSINHLLSQTKCHQQSLALVDFQRAVLTICRDLGKILASKKTWDRAVKTSSSTKPVNSSFKSSKLKLTCSIAAHDRCKSSANSQGITLSTKIRGSIEQIHPWGNIDRKMRASLIHGLQQFSDQLNELRPSSSQMLAKLTSLLIELQVHQKKMHSQFLNNPDLEYLCS
jgi:hypothetical protein